MMRRTIAEVISGCAQHSTRTLAQHTADEERELISRTLEATAYNVSEVARRLGVTRRGLYLKMRRLDINHHDTRIVSRQTLWQDTRVERGQCASCGARRPSHDPRYCDTCRARRRKRSRGPYRAWREGGPGRPPVEAREGLAHLKIRSG